MDDVDVELLETSPGVGPALLRGAATGAGRPGARGTLPRRRLVLTGVEQEVRALADFCEVTGGLLGDALPATWLHVQTFPLQVRLMAARDFPFPMLGMVHVANRMRVHRPVRVDETLTLSSWAQDLAPHRKGHTVDLRGEARVGDEVVWEGSSTYLVRSSTPPDVAGGDPGTPPDTDGGGDGSTDPTRAVATWRLPAGLGRQYARVAGDVNPIHLSALSAKALGFPRAIAHGMWTHARALAAVQSRLPGSYEVDTRFLKPILLPSTVVLRAALGQGSADLAVTDREGSRRHLSMQVRALP